MSDKEKDFIKKLDKVLPALSEFDKGYFLGVAEARASTGSKNENEDSAEPANSICVK